MVKNIRFMVQQRQNHPAILSKTGAGRTVIGVCNGVAKPESTKVCVGSLGMKMPFKNA